MAYDEKLADRIRSTLRRRRGVTEKKMFGGIAFLVSGNMCVGVHGGDLIARLEPADSQRALSERHVRVFDLTGRPMKGWVLVEARGLESDAMLKQWVDRSWSFAVSLDPK